MTGPIKHFASSVRADGMDRREFIGRSVAAGMTIAASGLYSQAALAGDSSLPKPVRGGNLRLGLQGGSSTNVLDPAKASSNFTVVMNCCWGDKLVESHPTSGLAVPALAESWEPNADASVWRFKIRKGVAFHNGSEMTADDVVKTLNRHADKKSESGARGVLVQIKSFETQGGDLVITLSGGNVDLPLLLSSYQLVIQPGGGIDNPNAGIGTGPFRLESFEPGVRATFVKNENDWRDDRGYVDSVEVVVMNDILARMAALSSGQVHFVDRVDPKTVGFLKRAPNVKIQTTSGRGHYCFLMRCDTAPFDNNDLRMALKYAIDRETMVEKILANYGKVGNDFPINKTYALFPQGIEQRVYDPDKAAFHFKKSGHEGPLLLRTAGAAFPGAVDAAVLYQQSAANAGITLEIKREPDDGYWSNVWNAKPFVAAYWDGRPTQDSMYSTAYLSSAAWNDTRFLRPDFDRLLLEARTEFDQEKRKEIYRDMALMVRDTGGVIVPMFNDFLDATTNKVKGFVPDVGGAMSNAYVASRVWLES